MRPAVPIACFVAGAVLMIGFEATITRILGVLLLFAFIVSGVFLVAHPGFLEIEDDSDGS
jgi:hypothetical protein